MRCDGCGDAIVGPRLQCVQCEDGVDLCVACVARDAGGKRLRLRDGRKHPKGHVYRRVRQTLAYTPAQGGAARLALASYRQSEKTLPEQMPTMLWRG